MNLRRRWNLAIASVLVLLSLIPSAAGQKVKLSSTTLDFGKQGVGVPSTALSVVLSNTDSATPLAISAVSTGGDFSETDNCNASVAPSGSCTLLVIFTPTATGTQTGVLTLGDDASNSPQLVTTKGTGVVLLAASPSSLTFGTVATGSASTPQTVTLTNNLKETVTVDISTSGDYAVAGSGASPCPLNAGLAASKVCTVSLTFKPTFSGSVSGALTIAQNLTPTPQIIALSGTGSGGSAPPLTFSPTSLSFSSTPVATTSSAPLTVTNTGSKSLTISAIAASGDFTALGGTKSPCGGVLGAGKQCNIVVDFSPTAAVSVNGALTITTNSSVKTQVLTLTGSGKKPVTVSPSSLTFAMQQQGIASASQTVTLTNHLATTLGISGITVSGDYARTASGITDCGSSLAASGSCTIDVVFDPLGTTGAIAGTLSIESNAGLSPLVVPLSGSAQGSVPRFAYVANIGENTLSEYTVDIATGRLRENGYVLTGNQPVSVVIHPSNKFVYVANFQDHTILGFAINSRGGLTQIGIVATGTRPESLAVVPSGKFLYAANDIDNNVSAYSVTATTGALTPVSGSPFPAGTEPIGITIHPSGKFAYVANVLDNTVSAYSISSAGALTAVKGSPFPTGQGPSAMVIDPSGKAGYVVNGSDNSVSAYKINTSTGVLTAVANYPTDVLPVRATIDRSGKFLYVANSTAQDISVYSINSGTAVLMPLAGSPFPAAGKFPTAIAIDATNQFLYSADQGANEISSYSISSTGALKPLGIVEARYFPFAIAMSSGSAPVTYTPRFLFLANRGVNTVTGFTVTPSTGALTAIPGSTLPTGADPIGVAVDPTGRFAYVANAVDNVDVPGSVSAYRINPTSGALSEMLGSPFAAGLLPLSVVVDPSGRFVYAANYQSSSISAYSIDPSTGALTPLAGSPFSLAPTGGTRSIAVDPSGRFLYAGNEGHNILMPTLSAFAIDPLTGALTQVSGSPYALSVVPQSLAIDPTGRFVYAVVSSPADDLLATGVSAYSIDFSTGALSAIDNGSATFAGVEPISLTVDVSGRFVYAGDIVYGTIYQYRILSNGGTQAILLPYAVAFSPQSLQADPSGQFLYAVEDNNGIAGFSINLSTGALNTIPGLPIVAGGAYALFVTGKIH